MAHFKRYWYKLSSLHSNVRDCLACCLENKQQTMTFEHCISLPLMECDSHPERVVLLGQIREDVGVEHSGLQEAAPQNS